jgi:hypothetical protein
MHAYPEAEVQRLIWPIPSGDGTSNSQNRSHVYDTAFFEPHHYNAASAIRNVSMNTSRQITRIIHDTLPLAYLRAA